MFPAATIRHVVVVMLLVLASHATTMAASPRIVMVYGGGLAEPMVLTPDAPELDRGVLFLYGRASDETTIDALEGRAFLNVAMFWGNEAWAEIASDPVRRRQARPADANQHGRLYLPTRTEPAVMVVTNIRGAAFGEPSAQDFTSGWLLTESDRDTARRIGIPGL